MRVSGRRENDIMILDVHGRVIGDADLELRRSINGWLDEIPAGTAPKVVLDLDKVSALDSSGLGVIVASYASVKKRGGRLVLSGLGRGLQNLIVITRLAMIFDVYESKEEAILSFQNVQE